MVELEIKTSTGLTRFFAGVGRMFRRKAEEAGQEVSEQERPEVRNEAEEALHMAMGWNDPDGEDASEVLQRKMSEAIKEA